MLCMWSKTHHLNKHISEIIHILTDRIRQSIIVNVVADRLVLLHCHCNSAEYWVVNNFISIYRYKNITSNVTQFSNLIQYSTHMIQNTSVSYFNCVVIGFFKIHLMYCEIETLKPIHCYTSTIVVLLFQKISAIPHM